MALIEEKLDSGFDSFAVKALEMGMPPASMKGKSTKPEPVKAAVISRRVLGDSKMKIARDLGITTNTVRRILTESEMIEAVQDGRSRAIGMIPKALDAVEAGLDKKDPRTGLGILHGVGVLKSGGTVTVNVTNWAALEIARLKAEKEESETANLSPKTDSVNVSPDPEHS